MSSSSTVKFNTKIQINTIFILTLLFWNGNGCKFDFEGFGIHLGAIRHMNFSSFGMIEKIADTLYNDLNIRFYRTSYEPEFSPEPDVYKIECNSPGSCGWIEAHKAMQKYPDAKFFASIWSPPYYMKNANHQLIVNQERNYYYYIKNITQIIKDEYNQDIELVSIVNEPENIFAPWDHTNMEAFQLCRMISDYNDPLVSACPENSYFWITQLYMAFKVGAISCEDSCKTMLTHAYALNINGSDPNFLKAYYDLTEYKATYSVQKPVWQTEVSSTYEKSSENQMKEAMDMSLNIINFVGTTCVRRYYFWIAYTNSNSGESLIWGDTSNGNLDFPKKYYAYKHFTLASFGGPKKIDKCSSFDPYKCLIFENDEQANLVYLNLHQNEEKIWGECQNMICTNYDNNWVSIENGTLPPESICSCTENYHKK